MRIISSQKFLDWNIVSSKIDEMEDNEYITLPIINAEIKDLEGDDLYILIDGHHRKAAADELEIEVRFEEVENEEGLTGEDLLKSWRIDSDYYYVDTEECVW